ncbi:MAG: hypothetical protein AAGD28_05900 [Bacteroidota bacterium]
MQPEEIIGLKIADMRFHYLRQNEQGLQEFFCYLKLSNEKVISIPVWPEANGLEEENATNLLFESALEFQQSIRKKVLDAEILDILFRDIGDFFSRPAILKLSNGFYLSEQNFASEGIAAGLCLWSQGNFDLEKRNWKGLKSYLAEKG